MLLEDIKWLGFQRMALKSDNEIAIIALLSATPRELRYNVPDIDQERSIPMCMIPVEMHMPKILPRRSLD